MTNRNHEFWCGREVMKITFLFITILNFRRLNHFMVNRIFDWHRYKSFIFASSENRFWNQFNSMFLYSIRMKLKSVDCVEILFA